MFGRACERAGANRAKEEAMVVSVVRCGRSVEAAGAVVSANA
jgi:hypothetical protein